jgi:hypothetical protein
MHRSNAVTGSGGSASLSYWKSPKTEKKELKVIKADMIYDHCRAVIRIGGRA